MTGFGAAACGDDESTSTGQGGAAGVGGAGGSKSSSGGSSSKGGSSGSAGNGGSSGSRNRGGQPGTGGSDAGTGGTGGLAGADEKCNTVARGAGLQGTFVAWLSDSTTDARDRLGTARGWVRTDGKPFADTVADIAAGLHYYSPSFDQTGNRITSAIAPVTTGTGADGMKSAPFGDYCQDYAGPNATYGVVRGELNYTDDRWTTIGEFVGDLQTCSSPARLYCFQIDHDTPVVASFPNTRKAFVTTAAVRPDLGRAAFDNECAAEAAANDLTGSYLAFVSTNTQAAASRFDLTGLTYGRMDGVPIVDQAADLCYRNRARGSDQHASERQSDLRSEPDCLYGLQFPVADVDQRHELQQLEHLGVRQFRAGGQSRRFRRGLVERPNRLHCNTWVKVYCLEQ